MSSWVHLGSLRPGIGVARAGADSRLVRRGRAGCVRARGPLAYTSCNSRMGNTSPARPWPNGIREPGHRPSQKVSTHGGAAARARADRLCALECAWLALSHRAQNVRFWAVVRSLGTRDPGPHRVNQRSRCCRNRRSVHVGPSGCGGPDRAVRARRRRRAVGARRGRVPAVPRRRCSPSVGVRGHPRQDRGGFPAKGRITRNSLPTRSLHDHPTAGLLLAMIAMH